MTVNERANQRRKKILNNLIFDEEKIDIVVKAVEGHVKDNREIENENNEGVR